MFNICRHALMTGIVIIVSICASLPDDVQRTESYALQNTEKTKLGRAITPYLKQHPGKSGFHVLQKGMDAFTARMPVYMPKALPLTSIIYLSARSILRPVL